MRPIVRLLSVAVLGLALGATATTPAAADGWHHDDWGHRRSYFFLGLNFGSPYYAPPPTYYYPAPRYYYYYSPPVYYAPPPSVVYVTPPPPQPMCRRFNGDAMIDGWGQPFYGVACLGRDGRWHIAH